MRSLPSPAQPATITIAPLEVRSASLAEQAYASLRTLILDRKISAGRPLQEGRLAGEPRISRTPRREALGAGLEALGGGREDETEHWHFDDRFHLIISTASGNVVLPRLVEELRV